MNIACPCVNVDKNAVQSNPYWVGVESVIVISASYVVQIIIGDVNDLCIAGLCQRMEATTIGTKR